MDEDGAGMPLEMRSIEAFLAVVTTGSFTTAAVSLGMSQPTLSQQIQRLEDKLGFALLDRNSRRVALSHEGALFVEEARRLIAARDRAWSFAKQLRVQAARELRLGSAFITSEIPQRNDLLDAFVAGRPDIALQVYTAGQERVIEAVSEGKLDAAIVLGTAVDGTEFARMKQAPGLFPEELKAFSLGHRRVGLRLPGHDIPPGRLQLEAALLTGKSVAMIDPRQSPRLLNKFKALLERAGATMFYPYESRHALEVERYGYRHGMPAISLNWFAMTGSHRESRVIDIEEFDETSELVILMRDPGASHAKAAFLEFCGEWRARESSKQPALS